MTCEHCKTDFVQHHPKQRFCTNKGVGNCKDAFHNAKGPRPRTIPDKDYGYEGIDYSHDFVSCGVKSNALHCSTCHKHIPKGHQACFELEHDRFYGVHCMTCYRADNSMQVSEGDQRHPFDLED